MQIWKSKTYGKNKLIGGKKIVIPVAQTKNSKSSNLNFKNLQKGQKGQNGKKIIIAVPKPKKNSISRHFKDSLSNSKSQLGGKKSKLHRNMKSNKGKNSNSSELDEDIQIKHQNEKKGINSRSISKSNSVSKSKMKKSEVQVPLCLFDSLIFLGDLNYRMELPRLEVRASHGLIKNRS